MSSSSSSQSSSCSGNNNGSHRDHRNSQPQQPSQNLEEEEEEESLEFSVHDSHQCTRSNHHPAATVANGYHQDDEHEVDEIWDWTGTNDNNHIHHGHQANKNCDPYGNTTGEEWQDDDNDDVVSDCHLWDKNEDSCCASSDYSYHCEEETNHDEEDSNNNHRWDRPVTLQHGNGNEDDDDGSFYRVQQQPNHDDEQHDNDDDDGARRTYEMELQAFGDYSSASEEDETNKSMIPKDHQQQQRRQLFNKTAVEYYQETEDIKYNDNSNGTYSETYNSEDSETEVEQGVRNFWIGPPAAPMSPMAQPQQQYHSKQGSSAASWKEFPVAHSSQEEKEKNSSNNNTALASNIQRRQSATVPSVSVSPTAAPRRMSANSALLRIPMSPLSPVRQQSKQLEVNAAKNVRLLHGDDNDEGQPHEPEENPAGSRQERRPSAPIIRPLDRLTAAKMPVRRKSAPHALTAQLSPGSLCSKSLLRVESVPALSLKDFRDLYHEDEHQVETKELTDNTTTSRQEDPTIVTATTFDTSTNSLAQRGSEGSVALKDFRLAYAGRAEDASSNAVSGSSPSLGSRQSLKDFHNAYHSTSENDSTTSDSEHDSEKEASDNNPLFGVRRGNRSIVSSTHHSLASSLGPLSSSLHCHSSNPSSSFRSMASSINDSNISLFSSHVDVSLNSALHDPEPILPPKSSNQAHWSAYSQPNKLPLPTQIAATDEEHKHANSMQKAKSFGILLGCHHVSGHKSDDDEQSFACDEYSVAEELLASHIEAAEKERLGKHNKRRSSLDAVSHPSQASQEFEVPANMFEAGNDSQSFKRTGTVTIRHSRTDAPNSSLQQKNTRQSAQKARRLDKRHFSSRRKGHPENRNQTLALKVIGSSQTRRIDKSSRMKKKPKRNGKSRQKKKEQQRATRRVHFKQNQSTSFRYFHAHDAPQQLHPEERQPRDVGDQASFNLLDEKDCTSFLSMLSKSTNRAVVNSALDHDSEKESISEWNRLDRLLHQNDIGEVPGDEAVYDVLSSSANESMGRVSPTQRAKCCYWFSKLYFSGSLTKRSETGKDSRNQRKSVLPQLSHFYDLPLTKKTYRLKLPSAVNSSDHSFTETTRSMTSNYSSTTYGDHSKSSHASAHQATEREEHTMRGLEDFFCSEVIDDLRCLHVEQILKLQNEQRSGPPLSKQKPKCLARSLRKLSLQSSRASRHVAYELAKYDTHEALRAVLSRWKLPKKKKGSDRRQTQKMCKSKKKARIEDQHSPFDV